MIRNSLHAVGFAFVLTIAAYALSQAGPLEPSAPPGPTIAVNRDGEPRG